MLNYAQSVGTLVFAKSGDLGRIQTLLSRSAPPGPTGPAVATLPRCFGQSVSRSCLSGNPGGVAGAVVPFLFFVGRSACRGQRDEPLELTCLLAVEPVYHTDRNFRLF